MPALLLFGAERIRGLQGRLICQGAHTQTHKSRHTIQKHTINKKKKKKEKTANMSTHTQKHTHKAHVCMHVRSDSNTSGDAHVTCINEGTLINTHINTHTQALFGHAEV